MSELTIALIAIASAAAAATSSVLQHRSAGKTPHAARHRQISHLLTRPAWLAGLVAGGAGLVLHAVALSGGGLALSNPCSFRASCSPYPLVRSSNAVAPRLSSGCGPRCSSPAWPPSSSPPTQLAGG